VKGMVRERMNKKTYILVLGLIAALTFSLYLGSCDNPFEKSDDPDNAIITGRVFRTEAMTETVKAGEVRAQAYSNPSAEIPYEGPLVYAYTDSKGVYTVYVPLGTQSGTGATGTGTGGQKKYQGRFIGGVILQLICADKVWETGMMLERGKTYNVWDVSVDHFGGATGSGT
jgi:hypothetical protein